jgi:hypothetical protein
VRHFRIRTLAVCAALVGVALSAGPAAAQQAYSTLECRAGTSTQLARGDDGTVIFGIDQRGVLQTTHESKMFHNWTQRCVGSIATIGGKRSGSGYCRSLDPAGDYVLSQWTVDEQKPGTGTYRLLYGTGKWKGISGGGTYESSGAFRAVDEGTYQNCITAKGTVLIPGRQ